MGKADKRARKRENQAKARAAAQVAAKKRNRMDAIKRFAFVIVAVVVLGGGVAFLLSNGDDDTDVSTETSGDVTTPTTATPTTGALPDGCEDTVPDNEPTTEQYAEVGDAQLDPAKFYTATIETSCGDIVVQLDVTAAAKGANNFAFLAKQGFFDGLTWHRAVTNFVIQGGDPGGDGTGGPGYKTVVELPANGYATGDLAWAKAPNEEAGTAGSQFFVVTGSPGALNGSKADDGVYDYGFIGRVISGLDNAQKIESLSPGDGPPTSTVYIFSVTIAESDTAPTTVTTVADSTTVPEG
jgi:cyclophilin family peptidyl-prolyl cis-trans isomerase